MTMIEDRQIASIGTAAKAPPILFDAILYPYRSLNPVGFWLLMVGVGAVSFTAGLMFWSAGAWPVVGFIGLDVFLVYVALKLSYRSGRIYETLELTEDTLTVARNGPGGEIGRWTFQPYWLRITMDDPPGQSSQLMLSSHGRALIIGGFLKPSERVEIANTLRDALKNLSVSPA